MKKHIHASVSCRCSPLSSVKNTLEKLVETQVPGGARSLEAPGGFDGLRAPDPRCSLRPPRTAPSLRSTCRHLMPARLAVKNLFAVRSTCNPYPYLHFSSLTAGGAGGARPSPPAKRRQAQAPVLKMPWGKGPSARAFQWHFLRRKNLRSARGRAACPPLSRASHIATGAQSRFRVSPEVRGA